ncbi:hypothetical protein [Acinetobacter brisouii]|nr:hypothetical protein [Acinetobacter brisouii]
MNVQANKVTDTTRKLSLKDKYGLMTRGLGWETSYVDIRSIQHE